MPLVTAALASALQQNWLIPAGGNHHASVSASADRLASVVSQWFANATAMGFPCSTAAIRRPSMVPGLISALSAGSASAAGPLLSLAIGQYCLGQLFGPGVANMPLGVGIAGSAFTTVFLDLEARNEVRAQQMAAAISGLALTTIAVFPPPLSPQPVL
ncbi:MAG: hypothetical protein AAFV53_11670 [Myxococcota bacterium]